MVFFRANIFTPEDLAATGMFDGFPTEKGGPWFSNMEIPRPESPWNTEKLNAEAEADRERREARKYHWNSPLFSDNYQGPSANIWASSAQHDYNNEDFAGHQPDFASHQNNQYPPAGTWNNRTYQVSSDSLNPAHKHSPYVEDCDEDSHSGTYDVYHEYGNSAGANYNSYQEHGGEINHFDSSSKDSYCSTEATDYGYGDLGNANYSSHGYDNFGNANYHSYQKQGQRTCSLETSHADGSSKTFGFAQNYSDEDHEFLDFANMFTPNAGDDKKKTKSKPTLNTTSSIDKFISAYISISREKHRLMFSKKHRDVTKSDIVRWKLPRSTTGTYWDPDEDPIMLLADAFDAFSLGRWVYDWAEVIKGADSEITRKAEVLWSLLATLAKKLKQARAAMKLIKDKDELDTVQGFVESADRLTLQFQKVLECTEHHIYDADKPLCGQCEKLGQKIGIAFVDAFFSDKDLSARVDSIMHGMQLWKFRYDVNCKEIVDYIFR